MVIWQPRPRDEERLTAVVREILAGDEWLIVTHERPDGDAIGSSLAMAQALEQLGKRWTFAVGEPLPRRYSYLPGFACAKIASGAPARRFSNVIALDCADEARFAQVSHWIEPGARVVNVDHHRTNPHYGQAAWVDERAAATCELVYHVVMGLGVPLSVEVAMCLYTGILTDTGGFSYPNTTREVHQIAAELLACGVQPYDIAEPALESRSWEQMRLLQLALTNLSVSDDGQYAAVYVTRGMLEGTGASDDDTEGLVGFARSIDTVEVGALFRETADGQVKVSLRSKRRVDVSRIAKQFGGGGHARAAGCTLACSLDEAMDKVWDAVQRALTEARS
ncbi:DHH family phosphoesterase [Alicyclobacillus cellulosilyticus]|uniref:DHH family phosphoesterase n=1 Tax=Alicyclobacillus cellulosilyticus TaxID=1003997 RepID=A0A917KBW8_9BACL|nr:bifunctional oligoribonuclease/PAP phosphatase NrnA [Alicyclobacillus cellulosilyticus]GGJ04776.1 DHH family phosphoesterase [Alicyclobacillus cellulosilyticus]